MKNKHQALKSHSEKLATYKDWHESWGPVEREWIYTFHLTLFSGHSSWKELTSGIPYSVKLSCPTLHLSPCFFVFWFFFSSGEGRVGQIRCTAHIQITSSVVKEETFAVGNSKSNWKWLKVKGINCFLIIVSQKIDASKLRP